MKQLAGSIRIGWVIEYKGKAWTVTKAQHIKPGKGGAFMQVEMKAVEEGTKTNERFRTEDSVEKLMVEEKDCQFLFEDSDGLTFMESETFEQFTMPSDILGDSRPFMTDGMTVYINFIDGKPISVELPMQVVCTVVETEPVVKGQTASSSYKPSILDNGVRVMVPPFINSGDKIVVATADATYVERAK
ncbi:MAG: elongation factor P [Alphaproteobacteria bacterium]|nr:elongation factor P [Alphaproteobacteria bacterium]MBQ8631837.1 elongation factor P [Alphaproteobacteria bacterium]